MVVLIRSLWNSLNTMRIGFDFTSKLRRIFLYNKQNKPYPWQCLTSEMRGLFGSTENKRCEEVMKEERKEVYTERTAIVYVYWCYSVHTIKFNLLFILSFLLSTLIRWALNVSCVNITCLLYTACHIITFQ